MIGSKISRRYAKALLSLGQEDGQYLEYGQNLNEFVGFCTANTEFFQVISNQIYSVKDRKKVLEAILEKASFLNVVNNFLRLVLEKNRMDGIEKITDYYVGLTDEASNITRTEIIAAKPLKQTALDKLLETLKVLTSKEVKAEVKEDPSLIGGIIVKIGDLVLDGSVRAQITGLQDLLKSGEYN